jgi:polysaccharide export outer membrane protein
MRKKIITGTHIAFLSVFAFVVSIFLTGCQTDQTERMDHSELSKIQSVTTNSAEIHSEAIILREGDVVKISFPAASSLDTVQQIRRDGQIVLPLTGETKAAGLTPAELEQKVISLYASQLTTKQAVVTIVSSSFPVFVTGAVIHPGKVLSDHPMTALEAIMESGGFDYTKANLKTVKVIRRENDRMVSHVLNLKPVMQGKESEPFYLEPADIIYVPEKFSWF